jgi:hypothetical protein
MTMNRFTISLLALTVIAPSAGFSEPIPGARPNDRPMEHAATTPLRDLNLTRDKVPPLLERTMSHPYATAGVRTCQQIAARVRELDGVLGADVDQAAAGGKDSTSAWLTGELAGSIIPGEGILRHVTGADKNSRHFAAAVYAGSVRRGFLKGLGASKGCHPPAAPR